MRSRRDVDEHLAQCRVVRVIALLPSRLPLVLPVWFVHHHDRFRLTQRDGSPLVRAVSSSPEVVMLFDPDNAVGERRVLRVRGHARVLRDRSALLSVVLRHTARYHLHPRALREYLSNPRSVGSIVRYYRERTQRAAIVEIDILSADFVLAPEPSC